jgi:hypothetical protein
MNYTITIDYRQNRLLVEALCNYHGLANARCQHRRPVH